MDLVGSATPAMLAAAGAPPAGEKWRMIGVSGSMLSCHSGCHGPPSSFGPGHDNVWSDKPPIDIAGLPLKQPTA